MRKRIKFSAHEISNILAERRGLKLVDWRFDHYGNCTIEGAWRSTVTVCDPSSTLPATVKVYCEMPYEREFAGRVDAQVRGGLNPSLAYRYCLSTDWWKAIEESKLRAALKPPRDLWDFRSIPLGHGIGHTERIERLEAAVISMASASGHFESLRSLLSLGVNADLRNVLERKVTYSRPV